MMEKRGRQVDLCGRVRSTCKGKRRNDICKQEKARSNYNWKFLKTNFLKNEEY
jgi:hypothetical protein